GGDGAAAIAAIDALEQELAGARQTRERDLWFGNVVGGGLAGTAMQLYRNAIEQEKPDAEREPGYQERDAARLRGALEALDKRFDPGVDKALMALRLRRYASQVPADQRVAELDAWLGIDASHTTIPNLEAKLDALYAGTSLDDAAARLGWLDADRGAIEASSDPALQLAVAMTPVVLAQEAEEKARAGRIAALRPRYMQAMIDFNAS